MSHGTGIFAINLMVHAEVNYSRLFTDNIGFKGTNLVKTDISQPTNASAFRQFWPTGSVPQKPQGLQQKQLVGGWTGSFGPSRGDNKKIFETTI